MKEQCNFSSVLNYILDILILDEFYRSIHWKMYESRAKKLVFQRVNKNYIIPRFRSSNIRCNGDDISHVQREQT